MDNSIHPVTLSAQASYTLDDAIAHLLGLLKRGLVKSEIKVTLSGVVPEDLHEISTLPGTLNEHLIALTNAALSEGNTEEAARIDRLLKDADIYMQYLTDEIAKGPDSAIRIDQDATQQTGVRHFTLKSINDWHKANKAELDQALGIDDSGTHSTIQRDITDNGNPSSTTKVRNLNNTLGLLLQLIIDLKGCPGDLKKDKEPNYLNLAKRIEDINNQEFKSKIPSQSSESVRKVLQAAYKQLTSY